MKKPAASLILLFMVSLSLSFAEGSQEAAPVNVKGIIEYLEGEVTVNGVSADFGQVVEAGSVVKTGAASYCEVVFGGKNIFRLEENTIATLDIDATRNMQSISLDQGSIAAVFEKLQKIGGKRGTFSVNTPTAVAGIRGTAFYIRVEDENNTYICTCNGRTALEDQTKTLMESVRSDTHKAFRFSTTTEGVVAVQTELLYHDNATMDRLADKISHVIPWGGNKDKSY